MADYTIGDFLEILNHTIMKYKHKRLNPVSASFEITSKCNLNCSHCYNMRFQNSMNTKDELNTNQIFNLINAIRELNILELTITGGEPFLRNDIVDILKYIKDNTSMILTIQTNGILLNEDVISDISDFLENDDRIQVSLDGTKEIHDSIRGEGTWEKAIKSLHILCEKGVPIEINLTPTSFNEDNIIDAVESLGRLDGLKEFGASPMAIFTKEDMKYLPDIQKMLANEKKVIKILDEMGFGYKSGLRGEFCQFHKIVGEEVDRLNNLNLSTRLITDGVQCSAGITKIHIDSKGQIFPCVYLQFDDFLMGDSTENSLKDIWDKWDITKTLRYLNGTVCSDCGFVHPCKGGCPGMAYSLYGTIDAPYPRCSSNEQ